MVVCWVTVICRSVSLVITDELFQLITLRSYRAVPPLVGTVLVLGSLLVIKSCWMPVSCGVQEGIEMSDNLKC